MDLHGGNIYRYKREGKELLDYSSNINPFGLPEKFIQALSKNIHILEKYPDPEYIALRQKIAEQEQLGIEQVIVGNGATEILFLYAKALAPKKALLVAPCFAEYTRALKSVDCEVSYFALEEKEEEFAFSMEGFRQKIEEEEFDLFVLCNPNNPTANFLSLKEIEEINFCLEEKKIHFFIDEAFLDFLDEHSLKTAMLLRKKNIFVLRAMTKFFAVPGLRLGYGLSFDSAFLEKMWQYKEPWSVNQIAAFAGCMFGEEKEYIEKTKKWIKEEKKYFYQELRKIKGIKAFRADCNFILCKLLFQKAEEFQKQMIEKGILVRNATNFPCLNGEYIRFAIKDRQKNQQVLEAIRQVITEEEQE